MQAAMDWAERPKGGFSVIAALVRNHESHVKVHVGGSGQGNPVFPAVSDVLVAVKFDLHED